MATSKYPPLSILREEEYDEKMSAITEELDQCRQDGIFTGFDGAQLYYEHFKAHNSHGAVVIVHGLSEFTAKYHEFAWYLINQGYDVFVYDQRCHGRSCRLTSKQALIHVDNFSDYEKDLHRFVCDVVRKTTDLPLYLYAHSMGGATAAQYLIRHPGVFRKAVLSAPMIEPLTGNVSPTFARVGLSAYLLFGDGKKKFWNTDEFDPDYPFARSQDQSLARFSRNMRLRVSNPCYQTTPLSFRWVQQSVMVAPRLLCKKCLNKVQTPILMLCAEQDKVVSAKAQDAFAKKCPACRQVIIPNTTHAMLTGTHHTIADHMQLVLDHFC